MTTQFITRQEKHVPYNTIQDVVVNQGFIERIFGLATVYIQNATSVTQSAQRRSGFSAAITLPGQSPASANEIAEALRSITLSKNSRTTGL